MQDNIMQNDISNELSVNFIEYAYAVNSDRAIPSVYDGLKPVAKRIIFCSYDEGFYSNKPHVKSANIVGQTMAKWHPHGDSSIYGALVRLSQDWVMRYPLIDFHGSNGNICGDGPAASRYTEARLSKIAEEGLLANIKKNVVDTVPNYSETKDEPVVLPAIFPNLLCNPNSGIGVAMASSWAPHNLNEVAQAIYDYIDGKEPEIIAPDFPTGGIIINGKDCKNIIKNGRGTVKIRAKYEIDGSTIIFTELPYGITIEKILEQIDELSEKNELDGVVSANDETNRKGIRIVIECEKTANMKNILNKLFGSTDLQSTFSYNQVALVDKTPTELGLKDCIKYYLEHNKKCLVREFNADLSKSKDRLEVVSGLLKALEDIDNIIKVIKASESAAAARVALQNKYNFTEAQSKAIVDMKLGRLANLEKIELETEAKDLEKTISYLEGILASEPAQIQVIRERLAELVKKFGDARRTEVADIAEEKVEKEIANVEPEKCIVTITESGLIKRIPTAAFKVQKKGGKGVKTRDDIISTVIRTNTIDSLLVFTDAGTMYRLLVDDIPAGSSISKGASIRSLINIQPTENPTVIYSIYRDTTAKYIFFVTKNGICKKSSLDEYVKTSKKTGVAAIKLREGDNIVGTALVNDEDVILTTKNGMGIRFNSKEVAATSRATIGIKGITLKAGDEVSGLVVVRDAADDLALFTSTGYGKRVNLSALTKQARAGKGVVLHKASGASDGELTAAAMVNDDDIILAVGLTNSICISSKDLTKVSNKTSMGSQVLKGTRLQGVSKV